MPRHAPRALTQAPRACPPSPLIIPLPGDVDGRSRGRESFPSRLPGLTLSTHEIRPPDDAGLRPPAGAYPNERGSPTFRNNNLAAIHPPPHRGAGQLRRHRGQAPARPLTGPRGRPARGSELRERLQPTAAPHARVLPTLDVVHLLQAALQLRGAGPGRGLGPPLGRPLRPLDHALVLRPPRRVPVHGHLQADQPPRQVGRQVAGRAPRRSVVHPESLGATPAGERLPQLSLDLPRRDVAPMVSGGNGGPQHPAALLLGDPRPRDSLAGLQRHLLGRAHLPDLMGPRCSSALGRGHRPAGAGARPARRDHRCRARAAGGAWRGCRRRSITRVRPAPQLGCSRRGLRAAGTRASGGFGVAAPQRSEAGITAACPPPTEAADQVAGGARSEAEGRGDGGGHPDRSGGTARWLGVRVPRGGEAWAALPQELDTTGCLVANARPSFRQNFVSRLRGTTSCRATSATPLGTSTTPGNTTGRSGCGSPPAMTGISAARSSPDIANAYVLMHPGNALVHNH